MAKASWKENVVIGGMGCGFVLIIMTFFSLVCGAILWLLWNWLAVLFHAPHISLWQAIGLSVLISIIGNLLRGNSSK